MLRRFMLDESGMVVYSELVLIATILVIGMITGLATVRDQVLTELADVADAISELDQSYNYGGVIAHSSTTHGSVFVDQADFCENGLGSDQNGNAGTQCLVISTANTDGGEGQIP